ncbi:MAG TPA: GntR family transcriptional regulator [Candidatus Binatia bacterium]|nr:GntR family transcriptional regulator [Candidatus Binatia bacterium]
MRLAKSLLSPVPLYFKVMTEIRDNILSGVWNLGFQLPGELDLAQRLGVSVITVRQALGHLTREGLVRRERAKGTYVTWSGPVKQPINLEIEAKSLLSVNPEGTSFKLLRIDATAPTPELRREFNLPVDEKIARITRVRIAHGRPLAFVNSYLPARLLEQMPRNSLLKQPLTAIIEDRLGAKIAGLKLVVSAKLADDETAAQLAIPTGSPVLFVERNYLHKKKLLLRTTGYYRSDLFGYEIKLKHGR